MNQVAITGEVQNKIQHRREPGCLDKVAGRLRLQELHPGCEQKNVGRKKEIARRSKQKTGYLYWLF